MASHDNDVATIWCEEGMKRCFDLIASLLHDFGDDIRARRGQEQHERNMFMIRTITSAATNSLSLCKRKIDDDHVSENQDNTASSSRSLVESNNQQNTASSYSSSSSSRSLVESKRPRDEPIRAQPIREIKPPVKKRKGPVKRKEPVRREAGVTPGWLVELMRKNKGVDAKMVIEKVITTTDLKPDQGRFLIPFKQITEMDFLNERELNIVKKGKKGDGKKGDGEKGDGNKGVDVILLNSNGVEKQWNANLRIWEMSNNFNYALCGGWNLFVFENDLRVNQTRSLWSFHSHDGTLFLAFDPLDVALALVPFNPSSEDPFVCEEINRSLEPKFLRRSRTPRVCVQIITSDSSNLLEGLDLNRTPPPEDTEMDPGLESVQETHIRRSTSQESLTETSVISSTETTTVDLQLCYAA